MKLVLYTLIGKHWNDLLPLRTFVVEILDRSLDFLEYSDDTAYGVYGAYTALVYASGFLGGLFADRLMGRRQAAVLGGLLMAGGHLMMTVENTTAFYFALGLLITGNGFFKPNISTIVGTLYPERSPRRDGGFTIYYMGVNLGATLAPLVCGYIGERYGWHWGFGLAGIGMTAGLIQYTLGGKYLGDAGLHPVEAPAGRSADKRTLWIGILVTAALLAF